MPPNCQMCGHSKHGQGPLRSLRALAGRFPLIRRRVTGLICILWFAFYAAGALQQLELERFCMLAIGPWLSCGPYSWRERLLIALVLPAAFGVALAVRLAFMKPKEATATPSQQPLLHPKQSGGVQSR